MSKLLLVASFLFALSSNAQTDTLTFVSYNLLNFPDGRDDCGNNVVVPNRADSLRKILGYLKPDIFVGCEIQTEAGADSVLSRSLNVFGATNYAAAAFHVNSTGPGLQNQLYYNTDKLTFVSQDYIVTGIRDIDHYVLYVNDPNLGMFFDTTFVEVYMCHLKAGSATADKNTRAEQTQLLMDYIATRPSDRNVFVCGDLNLYTSSEIAYANMITGPNALKDPINSPGNWNSNSSFAAIHTQSTRSGSNFDCGSTGGLDDRFDHIIVSNNVINGTDSLKYLPNSYHAVGNDGNHYNTNLIGGPVNSMYPDSVVKALYYMSDHLPVTLKAVVTYPTSNGLALYPVVNPVTCYGASDGEITIVPNDGQAPYTYQWDAAAGNQTTATATGLSTGSYCVQVTDFLGETDAYCVSVSGPSQMTYGTFLNGDQGACTGAAYLVLNGGQTPYTVTWNDSQNQTGTAATDLCAGNYEATVVDAAGCSTTIQVSIQLVSLEELTHLNFGLYPNPANEKLTLELENPADQIQVEIIDVMGRVALKKTVFSETKFELNVATLDAGMYTVRVVSMDASQQKTGTATFVKS